MSVKTADLYDEYEDRLQVCEPIFNDYGGHVAFQGEIATVKCFEDNSEVKAMLASPGDGRVLVVDAGGSRRCAMLGDLLAQSGVDNGWAGVLMFGCIRDAEEIGQMPIGVKALATIPKKSVKRNVGERDLPVEFAQVRFQPGDMLFADRDGVVVLAKELAK